MDKVRAIAKVIWDQRFWVLSVLGLIIAVVCWNMASGALDTQFSSRKSAIDKQFTDMNGLKTKAVHPNEAVNTKNQEAVTKQTEIVNAVWKSLYQRQKDAVLKWPNELGDQFTREIEKLKFRDAIPMNLRSIYQNYIGKRFDGLLDIVKAQKLAEGATGGGGRGGYEMYGGRGGEGGGVAPGIAEGAGEDYLVQWTDQDKLRAKLAFATNKPTALQIWVTQEDLWVYETLLNVIAKTNAARGATRPDNTAIHTIMALEVGAGAATGAALTGGHIFMPQAGAEGGGMAGEMGGGGEYGGRGAYMPEGGGEMGGEMGGRGGYMPEGGGDPAALDSALLTSRYLDHTTGAPLPGEGDFGLEYRQLPIRMDLYMDQRYLPQLLIECANSPLPIEVKQVRINPDKSMAGFEGGSCSGAAVGANLPNDPVYGQVEIRGVVFIYNEPTVDPAAAPATDGGQVAAQ